MAMTIDLEARTVQATLSTQSRVRVFDPRRGLIEEVLLARGLVVADQVPLLDSHNRDSLEYLIGSVRDIGTDGDSVVGRLHFVTGDKRGEKVWNLVRGGHLTDVSIGYAVLKAIDIEPGRVANVGGLVFSAKDLPVRVATKFEIHEVSVVPIGADHTAKFRESSELCFATRGCCC